MKFSNLLLQSLAKAQKVAVLTGAGVSAESGVATFRDPDGLWSKLNPAELASMDGFLSNPELVWTWYNYRRKVIASVKPNPGHFAIAEMEKLFPEFSIITQNIDRLHQAAGSTNVIELHGNMIDNHCAKCGRKKIEEIDLESKEPPKCDYCGGLIRPSVVWFGEMLPADAIENAQIAAETCDIFFSVGTSAQVYPAAGLPTIAKRSGALLVEVNPNKTELSPYADIVLDQPSGIALPQLLEAYKKFVEE